MFLRSFEQSHFLSVIFSHFQSNPRKTRMQRLPNAQQTLKAFAHFRSYSIIPSQKMLDFFCCFLIFMRIHAQAPIRIWHPFPFIRSPNRDKLLPRNPEFRKEKERTIMSNNSSNKLNVPQAKQGTQLSSIIPKFSRSFAPYEVRDLIEITVLHRAIHRRWNT